MVITPADLAVALYDQYERRREVKHYYGLLALYGLARTADAADSTLLFARCEKVLRRFPDDVDHPTYNFPSYTIGGIPQAFLLASGRMNDRADVVRAYADEMLTAPRDPTGIMKNPHHPELDLIWIDTAMAVASYLLYAGLALDNSRYIDEGVRQAVLMHDELIDPATGLLNQCKNFVAPGVRSQDHWSRGNGWGYFALAELVRGLPETSSDRAGVTQRFTQLSAALLPHQSADGLWRQEIPRPDSYEESSGSGLILYGIGVGLRSGVLDSAVYRPAFERGIHALVRYAVNDDFSIEHSCEGTLCPGSGDEKGTVSAYMARATPHDEPHGCGPIMLALTEAYHAGIPSVSVTRAAERSST